MVASAGNSGDWGNPEHVPAACPSTVTVSALAPSFDRTYWSSFDAAVDLTAPGLDIISVDSTFADNSPTPHLSESGTSMAAPVVAGVAALIRSAHPGWTVDQVIDKLRTSAQDLDVPGRDPNTGYGLVDAAAALNVATPLAQPSDYFVTWAERVYKGGDGEYTVGWTTPARHAVTGYVVTVHGADGSTTDYPVDGQTVRTVVTMGQEDGWTVTAQTTAGDVTTYPLLSDGRVDGRGERPEKFRKLRLDRQHRHIVISWAKPKDPESIDRVQAHVQLVGGKHIHGRLRVDHTKPFPRSMRVKVPKSAAWYDIAVRLSVINTDDSGNPIGYGSQRVHRLSPAPHGTRVNHVLGAGKHAAEVTGLVTHENAKRVCGNNSCAGQLAKLVIDRGKQIQRVPVRFTQNGVFHATVWTPPGADTLRLRIIGPKRLDSGPFRRVAIDRGKRSDDCQPVAPSAPARGC